MQKLGFPSMKSLDQFKSFAGSATGTTKSFSFSSRPASDSISSGSFTNLKLTAGFDQKILVVWFIFSENWAHFVTCVVDLFVCREVGEGASFREDWSGNGGMISLSLSARGCFCVCVCALLFLHVPQFLNHCSIITVFYYIFVITLNQIVIWFKNLIISEQQAEEIDGSYPCIRGKIAECFQWKC